jgi:ubiquitin-protein ligase
VEPDLRHRAAVVTSIQSLLTDLNPNSSANVEAAKLY